MPQDAVPQAPSPPPAQVAVPAESSSSSSASSSSDDEERVVVLLHLARFFWFQTFQPKQDKGGQKEAIAQTTKASGKSSSIVQDDIVHVWISR